jgi:hypothetical protein
MCYVSINLYPGSISIKCMHAIFNRVEDDDVFSLVRVLKKGVKELIESTESLRLKQ